VAGDSVSIAILSFIKACKQLSKEAIAISFVVYSDKDSIVVLFV